MIAVHTAHPAIARITLLLVTSQYKLDRRTGQGLLVPVLPTRTSRAKPGWIPGVDTVVGKRRLHALKVSAMLSVFDYDSDANTTETARDSLFPEGWLSPHPMGRCMAASHPSHAPILTTFNIYLFCLRENRCNLRENHSVYNGPADPDHNTACRTVETVGEFLPSHGESVRGMPGAGVEHVPRKHFCRAYGL